MAGHGGRRPGAGGPTKLQMEQKERAAKEKLTAAKARRKAALAASWTQIETAASAGERWAIELLLNHEIGRPGQKVQVQEDTTINLLVRWPRKPQPCPHCGVLIKSFDEKPAPEPFDEVDAHELVVQDDPEPDDWPDPFEEE